VRWLDRRRSSYRLHTPEDIVRQQLLDENAQSTEFRQHTHARYGSVGSADCVVELMVWSGRST